MEEAERLDATRDDRSSTWLFVSLALIVLGAGASIALIFVGVELLKEIHGSECHGEFPVCTTPGQETARQTLAAFCAVGLLAYLFSALPLFRSRRFNWACIVVVLVIVFGILALIVDPVSHLSSEAGVGQWFLTD